MVEDFREDYNRSRPHRDTRDDDPRRVCRDLSTTHETARVRAELLGPRPRSVQRRREPYLALPINHQLSKQVDP
jgi:hypothetical protein